MHLHYLTFCYMVIHDRIRIIIDELFEGNVSAFCKKIGVKQPTMNTIIGGRKSKPSYDVLNAIINAEALNISADWLFSGYGEMIKKSNSDDYIISETKGLSITTEEEYRDASNKGLHFLPQVNFKFAAGQTLLVNRTEDITRYWYLPDCKDCEGVTQVVGRSMSPTLPSGCWVALKRYTLPTGNPNTIPFGNIFGVVVEDEKTGEYNGYIKVLRRYKDISLSHKYWIAHSINDTEFDDFDIEIEQVRSLWIVKQHIVSDI